jgi:hemerythrin
VGVAEIDGQHKKLIDMINELNDAMRRGEGKDVVGKILNGLVSYAASHFRTEESYFVRFGYPEAAQHKQSHADFVAKVGDFKRDFVSGKLNVSVEVMSFLSNWLKGHIKGTDKKYTAFFHQNGLK